MTTCTRYPCGGTRHGCPMDDCPGRQDATPLADLKRFLSVAKSAKEKCVPLPIWDHDITALEKSVAALSTRSASAGPQTEAVAIFPALDAAQEALNLGAAIRYLRETPLSKFDPKHLIVLIALVQSRLEAAHPQPQQADGRGAVIEECARAVEYLTLAIIPDQMTTRETVAAFRLLAAKNIRALQSPATDNAPAVSSRAHQRNTPGE